MYIHNIIIPKASKMSYTSDMSDTANIANTLCNKYLCIPDLMAVQKLKTLKNNKKAQKKSKKQ